MSAPERVRNGIWGERISKLSHRLGDTRGLVIEGRLTRMVGLTLEAVGCNAVVGDRCLIHSVSGQKIEAEVVGFEGDRTFLMPLTNADGLKPGALVTPADTVSETSP